MLVYHLWCCAASTWEQFHKCSWTESGIILDMSSANERQHYISLWLSPNPEWSLLNLQHIFGNYTFEITTTFPRGQWVIEDINSSPPIAIYMHWWTWSTLVQVVACHLSGATPLPAPMLPYYQLDAWEQTSVNFESKIKNFSFIKMHLKLSPAKWWPYCTGEMS